MKFGGATFSKRQPLPPSLHPDDLPYVIIDNGISYLYYPRDKIATDEFTTVYFGEAFKGPRKVKDVVVKIVSADSYEETSQLKNENIVFGQLYNSAVRPYIPEIYLFRVSSGTRPYYTLISERVGPSLETFINKQLSIKTCLSILYQGIEALEALHNTGFVHDDIKSGNMCIGLSDPQNLKLIDLGLCMKFMESATGIPRYEDRDNGSPYYVSPDIWYGRNVQPVSRKHDLQSLLYVFLELYHGTLPWRSIRLEGVEYKFVAGRKKQIADQKQIFIVQQIDNILDPKAREILIYYYNLVWSTGPFDKPNYKKLKAAVKRYPGFTRDIILSRRNLYGNRKKNKGKS
jgi:serine/threonine protein kinase